ncbi:MAG: hypothetical protein GTO03_12495, partial [Planctomycetales bacterium]|nr:hypothetical protein [Planctomycetales bacterium]
AEWIEYDQNPAGLKGIVRLVVRTRGGPNRPLVLYAVDKPADFPLAAYVDDEEIEVTG